MLPHVLAIRPNSIVDYGAGNSNIAAWIAKRAAIKGRVVMYDPAVPGRAEKPVGRFDLLVSFDVLEHIPGEELDAVLAEMASMADHFLHVIDSARPRQSFLTGETRTFHCTPPIGGRKGFPGSCRGSDASPVTTAQPSKRGLRSCRPGGAPLWSVVSGP
jgi:hypothetical protein